MIGFVGHLLDSVCYSVSVSKTSLCLLGTDLGLYQCCVIRALDELSETVVSGKKACDACFSVK